ncbi:MAG: serine/threonine protein kinase [Rudaea sp.]
MELDDMKLAWQTLDRRLDLQNALNLSQFRESKLDKARSGLRRLYWGQIVQILFGDAMILFGILSSMRYHSVPHLLICGLCVLFYGVLIVVCGGVTLSRISRIDYSAAVVDIQKQVGSLRRTYVFTGMWAGLPWWLLWIPILVLEAMSNVGVDLFITAPAFVWINVAVGIAGLFATLAFRRWSRNPQRPRMARAVDNAITGRSLRSVQGELDEIARFESM